MAGCKSITNESPGTGDTLILIMSSLVCGVIYWYLWTVLVPRLRGYRLEEEVGVLDDGTSVTKLVKVRD